MLVGIVLSILLLIPLAMQFQLEQSRKNVFQLDRTNVSFCQLEKCGTLSEFQNLEPLPDYRLTETEFGTEVVIDIVNHARLEGKREVWAILRTPKGKIIEGMKIWLELKNSGRNQLTFFFTGSAEEFRAGILNLGF